MPSAITLYFNRVPMTREIKDVGPPCSCDQCNPDLYLHADCHLTLDLSTLTTNRYGNMATAVPAIVAGDDGMDLARQSIAYASKPLDQLNNTQLKAIEDLVAIHDTWQDELDGSGQSVATRVPDEVLAQMVQCFSHIFFFSALPEDLVVRWNDQISSVAVTKFTVIGGLKNIELHLHPRRYNHASRGRKVSRLSSLLHEAIHAYLESLVCWKSCCPTYRYTVEAREGHGRAFMMLWTRLLPLCFEYLSIPALHIDQVYLFLHMYLESERSLPSLCEWREYGLADEDGGNENGCPNCVVQDDGTAMLFKDANDQGQDTSQLLRYFP